MYISATAYYANFWAAGTHCNCVAFTVYCTYMVGAAGHPLRAFDEKRKSGANEGAPDSLDDRNRFVSEQILFGLSRVFQQPNISL